MLVKNYVGHLWVIGCNKKITFLNQEWMIKKYNQIRLLFVSKYWNIKSKIFLELWHKCYNLIYSVLDILTTQNWNEKHDWDVTYDEVAQGCTFPVSLISKFVYVKMVGSDVPALISSQPSGLRQSTVFCTLMQTGVQSSNIATNTDSCCFCPAQESIRKHQGTTMVFHLSAGQIWSNIAFKTYVSFLLKLSSCYSCQSIPT